MGPKEYRTPRNTAWLQSKEYNVILSETKNLGEFIIYSWILHFVQDDDHLYHINNNQL